MAGAAAGLAFAGAFFAGFAGGGEAGAVSAGGGVCVGGASCAALVPLQSEAAIAQAIADSVTDKPAIKLVRGMTRSFCTRIRLRVTTTHKCD